MIPRDTPAGTRVFVTYHDGSTTLETTLGTPWPVPTIRQDYTATWNVFVSGSEGEQQVPLERAFLAPAESAQEPALSEKQRTALWELMSMLEGEHVSVHGSYAATFAKGVSALKEYLYSERKRADT